MTIHPATPKHQWTNPRDLREELEDLADMAAAAGFHVPLRDVLAHLLNVRATVRGAADETLTTVAP